jgi:oligoribonuclease
MNMIWVDLETTGLDTQRCQLLEIGLIVTDPDLIELAHWNMFAESDMSGYWEPGALKMHQESGLLDHLQTSQTYSLHAIARSTIREFVAKWSDPPSPMCGSTIGSFDRPIIRRLMPALDAMFHYRCIDVSSLKELARQWGYPPYIQTEPKAHRALQDIRHSIAELRWYREHMLEG